MAKTNKAVQAELNEVNEIIENVEVDNVMAMLSELDEILEVTEKADDAPSHVNEFELEAAVAGAERTEATLEAYAEQDENTEPTEMNLDAVAETKIEAVGEKAPRAPRAPRAPSPTTVSGKLVRKT